MIPLDWSCRRSIRELERPALQRIVDVLRGPFPTDEIVIALGSRHTRTVLKARNFFDIFHSRSLFVGSKDRVCSL